VTSVAIKTVGVIGLGKMGEPIARHLVGKSFTVYGCDIDAAANRRKERRPRRRVSGGGSPVERSGHRPHGFRKTSRGGAVRRHRVVTAAQNGQIVAVAATISPTAMRGIGERLRQKGLVALDIPICRGEPAAEAGKLLVVGGGDAAAFERCRPAMSTFADAIHYLGPIGCGQVGKMVNNLILWACISANYEGLKIGEKLGVDREAMRTMLLDSSGQNWPLQTRIDQWPMPWAELEQVRIDETVRSRRSGRCNVVVRGVSETSA
jgi:3-hydroxyisobutyrate dehydrogenase-like beta-hydroxyacid dehydrogenase